MTKVEPILSSSSAPEPDDVAAGTAGAESEPTPDAPGESPLAAPSEGETLPDADSPASGQSKALRRIIEVCSSDTSTDQDVMDASKGYLNALVQVPAVASRYHVVFFHDERPIVHADADIIYRTVTNLESEKPILLILHSGGGTVSPAYFISKLCREFAHDEFAVAVPRLAKSAATLICCGADVIHMGHMSELGPIDPQVRGGIPALALKHAVEHIAELSARHPRASEMFASYLAKKMEPEMLGYYERVASSSAQYAERLLAARRGEPTKLDSSEIARRLVYSYKDHGFAIDMNEAAEIFGDDVITTNSDEYELANSAYEAIELIERALKAFGKKKRRLCVRGTVDGLVTYEAEDD